MNEDIIKTGENKVTFYQVFLGGRLFYVKREEDSKDVKYEIKADVPIEFRKRIIQIIDEEITGKKEE